MRATDPSEKDDLLELQFQKVRVTVRTRMAPWQFFKTYKDTNDEGRSSHSKQFVILKTRW